MVKYSKAVGDALRFCVEPRRWIYYFLIYLTFLFIFLAVALSALPILLDSMAMGTFAITNISHLAAFAGVMGFLFVIFFMVDVWIKGTIVHQAANPKHKIEKSFDKAWERFPTLLGANILEGILVAGPVLVPAFILGMAAFTGTMNFLVLPWMLVGFIVMIFFLLAFLLLQPIVMLTKKGVWDSLKESFGLLRKRPLSIIWMAIILVVFAIIISTIAQVPFNIVTTQVFYPTSMGSGTFTNMNVYFVQMIFGFMANLPIIVASYIIALIGGAIAKVFTLALLTDFYKQVGKRRFLKR